jgi:F-type H+-transporting ATPase subunit delta
MSELETQIATVFDSEEQHVGQVYAKALLEAAAKTKQVDSVVDELDSLVKDVLVKSPKVDVFLANPRVSVDDKIDFIDRVFGSKMNKVLLNFLKVLCRRQRIQFVRAILQSTSELRDEAAGRVQVEVTTSTPLSGPAETSLVAKLKSTLQKDVRLVKRVDPKILGGLLVRVGDTVIDGSVDGQLTMLRREMTTKADAAIRNQVSKLINS